MTVSEVPSPRGRAELKALDLNSQGFTPFEIQARTGLGLRRVLDLVEGVWNKQTWALVQGVCRAWREDPDTQKILLQWGISKRALQWCLRQEGVKRTVGVASLPPAEELARVRMLDDLLEGSPFLTSWDWREETTPLDLDFELARVCAEARGLIMRGNKSEWHIHPRKKTRTPVTPLKKGHKETKERRVRCTP